MPTLTACGGTTTTSTLTPERREAVVCVCVRAYINSKWCNNDNIYVTDRTCTPYIEVLSLSIRPYYLYREFLKINLNVVSIPLEANARQDHITSLVHDQLNKSRDSIVLITDFNRCTLGTSLPTLHQYVTCPTRNNKT